MGCEEKNKTSDSYSIGFMAPSGSSGSLFSEGGSGTNVRGGILASSVGSCQRTEGRRRGEWGVRGEEESRGGRLYIKSKNNVAI